MKRLLFALVLMLAMAQTWCQTFINVTGSDDKTAISGWDTVAFFTEKKAVRGTSAFQHEHLGAVWLFASQANLDLFKADPERYLPEWGGHCAWGIAEGGYVSKKKLSGDFAVIEGKLYLFSFGNQAKNGPWQDFLYGRTGSQIKRIEGDKKWVNVKRQLESGEIEQANARNYKRTPYE